MQTRKRAKSVSFGKPKKVESNSIDNEEKKLETSDVSEKDEKVAVAADTEEKKEVEAESAGTHEDIKEPHEPSEAAKKVLEIEDVKPVEKEEEPEPEEPAVEDSKSPELSATPAETVTPSDDFITDTEPDKEPEKPKEEEKDELSPGLSPVSEPTLSTPILGTETKPESESSAIVNDTPATSEELSSTPPPSAFSLQEGGDGAGDSGGGKKRNFLVYFLVIALFSFILGIGAMAALTSGILPFSLPKEVPFSNQLQTINASPTAVPTEKPVATVAPTEKPLDLAAYTVSVLNGSGIRGKAAEVMTSLTTAGFKVGTTGNASSSDFESTQISAKKDVDEAYLEKLKTELEKDFKVEVSAAPAPASQGSDVVVTIGSETAN